MYRTHKLILSAILLNASAANASDGAENEIRWHGFMSAGAAVSDSATPYTETIDEDATFANFRFGLNVSTDLSPEWRLAGQLISHNGSDDIVLDWGFATYHPSDSLTFNLGKIKYPNTLVSEYFEVGYAQPWLAPPAEFYSHQVLGSHLALESLSGATAIFKTAADSGLQYSLQPFFGESEVEDGQKKKLFGAKIAATGDDVQAIAGYSRSSLVLNPSSDRYAEGDDRTESTWNVGFSFERGNGLLYTEYGQSWLQDAPEFDTEAGYITLGYRLGAALPYVTYARMDQDSGLGQTSNALGVKYTLNTVTAVKLQWLSVDPRERRTPTLSGAQPSGLFEAQPAEDRINVIGASIDFVF